MDMMRLASTGDPISRVQAERIRALLEARPHTLACVDLLWQEYLDPRESVARLAKLVHEGAVEAACCPAERLPGWLPYGVRVGAIVRDRTPLYECVCQGEPRLAALPSGTCVVTTDPVARAQIRHRHPRLKVEITSPCGEILEALAEGVWDAACLPSALLEDGPLDGFSCRPIPDDEVIPAVGQGAVALLVKERRPVEHDLVAQIDDPEARRLLAIEGSFLRLVPPEAGTIRTARAKRAEGLVEVTGMIADAEGRWLVTDQARAPQGLAGIAAREIADACLELARLERSRAPAPEAVVAA